MGILDRDFTMYGPEKSYVSISGGLAYLIIPREGSSLTKTDLLKCYRSQWDKVYRNGARKIRLGKYLDKGASRLVVEHPLYKNQVVKIDYAMFSNWKPMFGTYDWKIRNQNKIEYLSSKKLAQTKDKLLLKHIAKVKSKSSKSFFMISQEKVDGNFAWNFEAQQFSRELYTLIARTCKKRVVHLDAHTLNVKKDAKGVCKLVDLGFLHTVVGKRELLHK